MSTPIRSKPLILLVYLFLLSFGSALFGEEEVEGSLPVQQWRFDSESVEGTLLRPARGELGGEILGQAMVHGEGELTWLELSPAAESGGGGILLSTDSKQARLPTGAMTVEAWVQLDATLEWGAIVGAGRHTGAEQAGWFLGYRRDRFFFGLAAEEPKRMTYLSSGTSFVLKAWYHVVASYDGVGQQRLYVDGKLSGESKVQRGAVPVPNPLFYTIGAYRDDDNFHPFDGRLAEISVWHGVLSAEEIAGRFEAKKGSYPGIEPSAPEWPAEDDEWATWRGDNARSGRAPSGVQLHPSGKPAWVYHPLSAPKPAWPETARSDHWRKRPTPETPKTTFDWVHDVVVVGGRVYFGSSADDAVRCLDAKTGKLLWSYIAGGPVRLAPTVSAGRVLFGCDDGAVYCLDAVEGSLRWKTRPTAMPDRRLPGNGRVMSVWPVRTGILAMGDMGYFGAGLFPEEGAWYCTVDLRDGQMIDEEPVKVSPQGYLKEEGGRLQADAGRLRSAMTLGRIGDGKKEGAQRGHRIAKAVLKQYPHAVIETPEWVIVGGEKDVAAFEPEGMIPVWKAEVDAAARGLAVAGGQLYVSTTSGSIYVFGMNDLGAAHLEASSTPEVVLSEKAERLMAALPRSRGYALVVGVGDGSLLRALAMKTRLHVIGIDVDERVLAELRKQFAEEGLYGAMNTEASARGSIALQSVESFEALPFVDGIFNLVTTGRGDAGLATAEAQRVLRPWDGVAVLGTGEEFRGQVPEGAGSWTHAYAEPGNTASSGDRADDGKMRVRWFGRPGPEHIVDRHLRAPPPLAGGGYLMIPGRDYLFGLDAHNGTVLWEREMPGFMRASMLRDCGNMVLDPGSKKVFAASGAKCLVINADSGETVRELSVEKADEEWGYLALSEGLLVGSAVDKGGVRREISYAAIWEGGYGDGKRAVCSRSLFAIDPKSGERRWTYLPRGAIANPSLCIADGRVVFLESRNRDTLGVPAEAAKRPAGRWSYAELIESSGAELVALDLESGEEVWRRPFENAGDGILSFYLSFSEGMLVAVHSRNTIAEPEPVAEPEPAVDSVPAAAPQPKEAPPARIRPTLHYSVRVMEIEKGAIQWERLLNTRRRPNLIHGEQDLHPVIAAGRLIVEPYVFDLAKGEELFTFKRSGGGGCGTISASSTKLYYRAKHPAEFDLERKEQEWVSTATRPGCWINMIPANGLLLVPEGSSGCVCGFPVQASMAYGAEPRPVEAVHKLPERSE